MIVPARITKTAAPIPMPAFAPTLNPPDGTSCFGEGDAVGSDVVDDDDGAEVEAITDDPVDLGPTVAASSKILFLSSQHVVPPQHHFCPPQFCTPILPIWSPGNYTVLSVTRRRTLRSMYCFTLFASQTPPRQYGLFHRGSVQPCIPQTCCPSFTPLFAAKFWQRPLSMHLSSAIPTCPAPLWFVMQQADSFVALLHGWKASLRRVVPLRL